MDPAKLKVVELRQELLARGLDTKGVKAVLVDRLRAALEAEGAAIRDQVLGLSPTKSDGHVSQDESQEEDNAAGEPEAEPVPVQPAYIPEPEPVVPENVGIIIDDSSEQPSVDEVAEEPASDLDNSQAPYHLSETQPIDQMTTQLSSGTGYEEESASASATNASTEDVEMHPVERSVPIPPIDEENDNAADVPEEKVVDAMEVVDAAPKDETVADESESKNVDEASQETTPADELKAAQEAAAAKEAEEASSQKKDGGEESRKRKRSRSPSPKRRTRTSSTAANIDDFTNVENEPEIDPDKVTLSWFDSDLQLRINSTDFCDARPISDAAFGLVWAGARATHGVSVGQKVFYEVQLHEKNARVNFESEKHLFNLRCGWSTLDSELQLGEGPLSFGYDGEGKKVRGGVSEDFSKELEVDDVVGVYLDLQSDPCTIEYTLNGESLGVAFEFSAEELNGAALFPHIISKNLSFKVNFGQLENNLLKDLKAKPRKKKEPVVVEAPAAAAADPAPVASEEAKEGEEESVEKTESAEEKNEATEITEGGEEESSSAAVAADAPTETVTEEQTPSADAAPAEQVEEAAAAPSNDVEMAEEKKPEEEEAEKKEEEPVVEAEKEEEEEEPLPEINRDNLPGYVFIGLVDKEHLVAGPVRPESRKECEVIMMIGLSGAGKTKWVNEWIAEHPEKKYVVLGASALIDRMKNPSLGRKIESSGRRQRISELCTRSLVALQDVAVKRRRNYILDQTNVFASAQRRKMKGFGDFRRTAVIVVPTDEEYERRLESCKNDIDKDNTELEQNEMKANFTLPTMDLGWFDEIKYTELEEAEATKLVEEYNAKGKKALPPPQKKRPSHDYRNDNRRRDFNNRDRQYSRWGASSDYRRGGGGGGYDNRSGGDRWGGGGGGGRSGSAARNMNPFRDDRPYQDNRGGNFRRDEGRSGYQPSYNDRRGEDWGNRRDFRSGGGSGGGGGGRSDYGGGRDQYRDNQQRNHYGRDHYSSSSSSSSHRRNDGRDQDFRERRREDGGGSNRRYDAAARPGATGAVAGRHDSYQKRDNGSAKAADMNNGGGAATQWSNAANWQQQLQWSNWQQQPQAQADAWNQGWAALQQQQQQGWQGWGQAATNTASSSAGQWKSYGSATTGSTGATSAGAAAGTTGQVAGQWDGHQWTGGSY